MIYSVLTLQVDILAFWFELAAWSIPQHNAAAEPADTHRWNAWALWGFSPPMLFTAFVDFNCAAFETQTPYNSVPPPSARECTRVAMRRASKGLELDGTAWHNLSVNQQNPFGLFFEEDAGNSG